MIDMEAEYERTLPLLICTLLQGCGHCGGHRKWMGAMKRWQRDSCLMTLVASSPQSVANSPTPESSAETGCVICDAHRDILISWNL